MIVPVGDEGLQARDALRKGGQHGLQQADLLAGIPLGEGVVGVERARLLRREGIVQLAVGREQRVVGGAARDAVHGEAVDALELPQGVVRLGTECAVGDHAPHGGMEPCDEIQVVLQCAHIEAMVAQAQVGGKQDRGLGEGDPLGIQLV